MAEDKKSFVLYADQISLFEQLPDDKAGALIKHIYRYVNDMNPESEDLLITIAFEPIKQQLKRDLKKFEQVKVKRSEAGKRSAKVRNAQRQATKATSVKQDSTKVTSVKSVEHPSTKSTVNVNDNVNDNDNDNVNDNVITKEREKKDSNESRPRISSKKFTPPSLTELDLQFQSKGLPPDISKVESEKFFSYYQSNGWKVGKNKMANWKSSVAGWVNRMSDFTPRVHGAKDDLNKISIHDNMADAMSKLKVNHDDSTLY